MTTLFDPNNPEDSEIREGATLVVEEECKQLLEMLKRKREERIEELLAEIPTNESGDRLIDEADDDIVDEIIIQTRRHQNENTVQGKTFELIEEQTPQGESVISCELVELVLDRNSLSNLIENEIITVEQQ